MHKYTPSAVFKRRRTIYELQEERMKREKSDRVCKANKLLREEMKRILTMDMFFPKEFGWRLLRDLGYLEVDLMDAYQHFCDVADELSKIDTEKLAYFTCKSDGVIYGKGPICDTKFLLDLVENKRS